MSENTARRKSGRTPLILIVLIAVLTPALSTLLFFLWKPPQTVNRGELLPPATAVFAGWRTADGGEFAPPRGKWTLLAVGGGDCAAACQKRLCRMRQLRLMLPGSYQRLHRAWLVTDDATPPATLPQSADCGDVADAAVRGQAQTSDALAGVQQLFGSVAALPRAATAADHLYLLNADGVWVMRFADELSPYHIRDDLKRLLRLSKGRRFIAPQE